MPTKKPRMQITMLPEDIQFFKEFAALQGLAPSTLVSQYLHEGIPTFRQLAQAMQELKKTDFSLMTDSQRARLRLALDGGIDASESALVMLGTAAHDLHAASVAPATPTRVAGGKKPSDNLIHTNKPSNPLPTRVPEATKSKPKLKSKGKSHA